MDEFKKNVAYIDGANLHNALRFIKWDFDYARFRIWLSEKYKISHAYIFIGYIEKYTNQYIFLQKCGYILIFKEVVYHDKKAKGNCDSDLIVQAMKDSFEDIFKNVLLVSSDGDFSPLVTYLLSINKVVQVLSPHKPSKCSILLKKTGVKISYIIDQKLILQK